MALATANLTFNIANLIGADFDPRRTKVWIEANVDPIIDTAGKVVRFGDTRATVNANGTGVFEGLLPTNAAGLNPTGFLYHVWVDYALAGTQARRQWNSGWFALTADSDLALVSPVAPAPPNTTDDAVIASRVSDPASQTRTALSGIYARQGSQGRADLGLATVAATGSYADLSGKPTLGDAAAKNTGTTAGTVAAGDDSRISGALQATDAPELIRDTMGAALVAGANVTITPNDVSDTITIAASGGGSTAPLTAPISRTGALASYTTTSTTPVDVDATNLAPTFTAPASGSVRVSLSAASFTSAATSPQFWSLRNGTTNVGGTERLITTATGQQRYTVNIIVSGLTPGTSYTLKWAWRSGGAGTQTIPYGGTEFSGSPSGPATMEVYAA